MSYTNGLDNPELYFQTVLWTGNGSSSRSITLDGSEDMQPDWTWIKARAGSEGTQQHYLYDSVRGATKYLQSSTSNAEATKSNGLSAFASDGFTIGDDNANNGSSTTYVAWNWKKTATAGFDIVTYTGNGSARTISHSLSAVPHFMIVFNRDSAMARSVYHHKIASDPATDRIMLNETSAKEDDSGIWNDTVPTSSVFSIGNSSSTNTNTNNYVIYLFSEKQGYSKFGSYEGNGNNDGTFVYTGFKPAWVMTKSIDTTSNWEIKDNTRSTFNTIDDYIKANANAAEDTGVSSHAMDFLSNGFKHRGSNDEVNGSETYIYMAFAESPFVNSNGVPNNAR